MSIKKVIYKPFFDYPITVTEIDTKSKMIGGHRISNMFCVDYVPELHDVIIQEHNESLEEMKKLERKVLELAHSLKTKI